MLNPLLRVWAMQRRALLLRIHAITDLSATRIEENLETAKGGGAAHAARARKSMTKIYPNLSR
ncbi:hypothetical protein [Jannaschia faecimaris]|uniref:hypothetical protein n=1 Tax=Jannaschia faecimaris TaxID=1244108 RepID=UPI000B834C21|nr:hypothetical protein [Jannaschia faecimaris]